MNRSILVTLVILVGLLVVYLFSETYYTTTVEERASSAYERLKGLEFDKVAKVVIAKGKGTVELKKEGGEWTVASAYGYPADQERVDKILKTLREIPRGEMAGSSVESHLDFEVDKRKGGFITLYDPAGSQLAAAVVGKRAPSADYRANLVFMRFGDEPVTYKVDSDLQSDANLWGKDAEGKNYLEKDLVKLEDDEEVVAVRVIRPGKDDLLVERRWREVPVEDDKDKDKDQESGEATEEVSEEGEKKEGEEGEKDEEKPETKKEEYFVVTSGSETHEVGKNEKWTASGLLNRGKTISVDDAAEPKDLAEYGLEEPLLKAVVQYRKKDKPEAELKSFTLSFGNAIKDEKGDTKDYYVLVDRAGGAEPRIYTVKSWTFDGWNKELKDFLPKPKEEEKKDEEKPEPKGQATEAERTEAEAPAGSTAGEAAEAAGAAEAPPPESAEPPAGGAAAGAEATPSEGAGKAAGEGAPAGDEGAGAAPAPGAGGEPRGTGTGSPGATAPGAAEGGPSGAAGSPPSGAAAEGKS